MQIDRLLERLRGEVRERPLFLGDDTKTGDDTHEDVGALAYALAVKPDRGVVLACHDRYHACVGLLGCWKAGRVALFPPNLRADGVNTISERHGGASVLSDRGEFGTAFSALLGSSSLASMPQSHRATHTLLSTVYTSGSTGEPVACDKTVSQLFGEAEYLVRSFGLGSNSRVLSSAPCHHLYGLLFGVLMPLSAGAATVRLCSPLPSALSRAITEHEVDTLCAVPPHLAGLLSLEPRELAPLQRVFCSAGRLDADLAEALSRRFGVEVIEVFGSSETGGIAHRSDPGAPWRPFDCVSIARDENGVLVLESPFLAPGTTTYRTSDRIELHADGSFTHLGRLDDVVKIGGERVSVQEVENKIRCLAGVRDAAVVQVSSAGPRQWELWACIAASGLDAQRMRQLLGGTLEPVAVPRRVKLVDQLPRETSGKISRKRLLQLFEDEPS